MPGYVTNPQVIHETIDGETIIIDLGSGTYFSLLGAAPAIWNAVSEGQSDEQIVQRLRSVYEAETSDLELAVTSFVHDLVGCGLIAPSESTTIQPIEQPEPPAQREPFVSPRLERYTDMQEIILLDPVHKVDSQGWPHAAPAAAAPESL